MRLTPKEENPTSSLLQNEKFSGIFSPRLLNADHKNIADYCQYIKLFCSNNNLPGCKRPCLQNQAIMYYMLATSFAVTLYKLHFREYHPTAMQCASIFLHFESLLDLKDVQFDRIVFQWKK